MELNKRQSGTSQIGHHDTPAQDIRTTVTGTDSPTTFTGTNSPGRTTRKSTSTYRPQRVTVRESTGLPKPPSTAPNGEIDTHTPTMTTVSQTTPSSGGRSNRTGPIVGGIVGGIGGLLAILITIWFCWYRSSRRAALVGKPYPKQEVRHARRADLASTTEVISHGHIPAAGGIVFGPIPSTSSGDTNVRQYRSRQVLPCGGAPEKGRALTVTSRLPSTPSSGKGTSPAAQPHRAPLAEARAASRQHGEGGPASSLEGEGEDRVM